MKIKQPSSRCSKPVVTATAAAEEQTKNAMESNSALVEWATAAAAAATTEAAATTTTIEAPAPAAATPPSEASRRTFIEDVTVIFMKDVSRRCWTFPGLLPLVTNPLKLSPRSVYIALQLDALSGGILRGRFKGAAQVSDAIAVCTERYAERLLHFQTVEGYKTQMTIALETRFSIAGEGASTNGGGGGGGVVVVGSSRSSSSSSSSSTSSSSKRGTPLPLLMPRQEATATAKEDEDTEEESMQTPTEAGQPSSIERQMLVAEHNHVCTKHLPWLEHVLDRLKQQIQQLHALRKVAVAWDLRADRSLSQQESWAAADAAWRAESAVLQALIVADVGKEDGLPNPVGRWLCKYAQIATDTGDAVFKNYGAARAEQHAKRELELAQALRIAAASEAEVLQKKGDLLYLSSLATAAIAEVKVVGLPVAARAGVGTAGGGGTGNGVAEEGGGGGGGGGCGGESCDGGYLVPFSPAPPTARGSGSGAGVTGGMNAEVN